MYGEYHYSQPHGWDRKGRNRIKAAVKEQGFEEVDWAGEQRDYGDFKSIHPMHVSFLTFQAASMTMVSQKQQQQQQQNLQW